MLDGRGRSLYWSTSRRLAGEIALRRHGSHWRKKVSTNFFDAEREAVAGNVHLAAVLASGRCLLPLRQLSMFACPRRPNITAPSRVRDVQKHITHPRDLLPRGIFFLLQGQWNNRTGPMEACTCTSRKGGNGAPPLVPVDLKPVLKGALAPVVLRASSRNPLVPVELKWCWGW